MLVEAHDEWQVADATSPKPPWPCSTSASIPTTNPLPSRPRSRHSETTQSLRRNAIRTYTTSRDTTPARASCCIANAEGLRRSVNRRRRRVRVCRPEITACWRTPRPSTFRYDTARLSTPRCDCSCACADRMRRPGSYIAPNRHGLVERHRTVAGDAGPATPPALTTLASRGPDRGLRCRVCRGDEHGRWVCDHPVCPLWCPRELEMIVPFTARAFTPAHLYLANAAGVPAQLANEKYVESLARVVYYWGYPAVDTFGRTSTWQLMKEPGAPWALFPGAPKNRMGYLDDYMPPPQRKVVTPNNDTIYGVGLADLANDRWWSRHPTTRPRALLDDPDRRPVHHRDASVGLGFGHAGRQAAAGRAGMERRQARRASSKCCARRPMWPACSAAASPHTRRKRRQKPAPCSTRSAWCRSARTSPAASVRLRGERAQQGVSAGSDGRDGGRRPRPAAHPAGGCDDLLGRPERDARLQPGRRPR